MQSPEERLTGIMKGCGVDLVGTLPCDRIKCLIGLVCRDFFHIPLTREEEGVGIAAGAALAGRKPALIIQNSGVGNMINALVSLTGYYRFPLAVFVSHRGVYKEKIAAQIPMGEKVAGILRATGVPYSIINTVRDFGTIEKKLPEVYRQGLMHAFLLTPAVWEETKDSVPPSPVIKLTDSVACRLPAGPGSATSRPKLTRYEILKTIAPKLAGKVVVCNLGIPAKELYSLKHQASNFYMLGSMGMATPIGLGIALSSAKEVVVIDGDGSILMNPGTLATAAYFSPRNLTVLCIDNGAYGSTGSQPTLTCSGVDLETVAQGFGIRDTLKVSGRKQLTEALKSGGFRFIHALALPGNADVPNIPLDRLEIKKQVEAFLKG